jgi:hypothetical protein
MKLAFEILFYIMCINLATGVVIGLNLGGVNQVMQPTNPYVDPLDLEEQFNATAQAESWSSTPFSGIPIIGDIFAGFDFLIRNIAFLLGGFPYLLEWFADSFIVDATARISFSVLANCLRGLFAVIGSWFVVEFISGRGIVE